MNYTELKKVFLPRIGFRQGRNPEYQITEMTDPTTGLFYNDEHAVLTFNNLHSIISNHIESYPEFDPASNYEVGTIVSYQSKNYTSIKPSESSGFPIPTNSEYWKEYDRFTEWLIEKAEAGIVKAFKAFKSSRSFKGIGKNLLDRSTIIEETQANDEFTLPIGLSGYEISTFRKPSLKFQLEKVSITAKNNATFTVRLYSSQKSDFIHEIEAVYNQAGNQQWFSTDWTLEKGMYYLALIPSEESDRVVYNSMLINSADGENYQGHDLGGYIRINGFQNSASDGRSLDLEKNTYVDNNNFGLNMKMSVFCDLTNLIIEQPEVFDDIVMKSVAITLIQEILFNAEALFNVKTENMSSRKKELRFELYGDSTSHVKSGMIHEWNKAIKVLEIDTSDLEICGEAEDTIIDYRSI